MVGMDGLGVGRGVWAIDGWMDGVLASLIGCRMDGWMLDGV